jgi:hypothetical protein
MQGDRWILAGLVAGALLVGCTSTPASTLTDPTEIVVAAVQALRTTKTLHLEARLSGELPAGPGSGSAMIRLDGTTLSGDLDLAGRSASLTGAAPAFMDARGSLVVVGGVRYVKLNLLGDRWYRLPVEEEPGASSPTPGSSNLLSRLREDLRRLSRPPERLGDEGCGDVTCSHVRLWLTTADMAAFHQGSPPPAAVGGTTTIDLWVRQTDLRPAKVTLAAGDGETGQGKVTATVVFSDFDRPLTIAPPPADQVTDGLPALPSPPPFLPLPGLVPTPLP